MPPPKNPYKPYAAVHANPNGPGDARPTCLQVLTDTNKIGALKGKVILITGCSSGIGVETARALYETGATLFLTARDMKKLDGVITDITSNAKHNKVGPNPQAIEMHLDSLESVRKGAEDFKAKSGGQINILINNAGVMRCPYQKTKDGFEMQLGTNHFAHFYLFQLLKNELIASAASSGTTSRVICLSSAGHTYGQVLFSNQAELDAWNAGEGYEPTAGYGQSKTANIYMASSITRHYGDKNVHGLSVHPGGIKTELARHMNQEEFDQLAESPAMKPIFKTPDQGSATTVWAAVSDHFEGKNGGVYLGEVGEEAPAPAVFDPKNFGYSEWAYDEAKEETLWKLSYDAVNLKAD